LGDRGATLSGGERQRLSIARALARDATIVLLDEPSSALDAQTESLLLTSLEHLTRSRTTFLIAHRPSTLRLADRIIVLETGRLVDHRDLCERSFELQLNTTKLIPSFGARHA
jgi:ATP-binding cassette subfamily B protein/subfamily B ATP-binding cassette protein MsbA